MAFWFFSMGGGLMTLVYGIAKREPKNFVALNELAWTYAKLKNPASLATAQAASELAPDNPTVLDTLAEAQSQAGQKNEAVGVAGFCR